ncbi:MFS transporter [Actinoplanes sp. CA-030573]|uniref:MFS transporter n=1 Tax=Actinoplanes sp. CA-030573 TaxID=3239898 RepID=UPI003D9333B4
MVPHVLAAPLVGGVADAARRRRAFYLAAFLAYAALLVTAALLIGRLTVVAAVALLAAGCAAPLLIGGLTSLLGELAGDRLERAFGLDVTTYSMAGIAGPALAAVLAAALGASWSVVALSALAVAGGVLVASLPIRSRAAATDRVHRADPLAALRVMRRDRELGAVTAGSVFKEIGAGALPVIAALLAARVGDTAYTGLVLSVAAAGGLAGSLLTTAFPIRRRSPVAVVLLCVTGIAAAFLLVAAVPGLAGVAPAGWPALALFAVAGGLGAPLVVAVFSVRDRAAPPHLRTQVFTLGAGLKVTGAALGAAVAGLAAPAGVTALLLGVAGCQVLALLATAVVARVTPARRRVESIVS